MVHLYFCMFSRVHVFTWSEYATATRRDFVKTRRFRACARSGKNNLTKLCFQAYKDKDMSKTNVKAEKYKAGLDRMQASRIARHRPHIRQEPTFCWDRILTFAFVGHLLTFAPTSCHVLVVPCPVSINVLVVCTGQNIDGTKLASKKRSEHNRVTLLQNWGILMSNCHGFTHTCAVACESTPACG